MSATAYKLIGFVVWRALKWYVREQLPSARRIVLSTMLAIAAAAFALSRLRRLAR